MDALSAILKAIQLEGMVCHQLALRGTWGLDIRQKAHAQFWRVITGSCTFSLVGGSPITLVPGDIVFIPHSAPHWLADQPASPRVPLVDYVQALATDQPLFHGAGAETQLTGGYFQFDPQVTHPFLTSLPPLIHIPRLGTSYQYVLKHTGHLLLTELTDAKPGSDVLLRNLAEMLFVSIIRAYLEQKMPENSFLAALNDPQISQVLRLMHEAPAHAWTLESLAKSGAMSRSVFAARFKQLVGETPLTYLTNWRMSQAMRLLVTEKISVSEVADKVGYQSEAAFNRVFKAKTGNPPASYRRHRMAAQATEHLTVA
jgi:AraC-like DNA-binding protein